MRRRCIEKTVQCKVEWWVQFKIPNLSLDSKLERCARLMDIPIFAPVKEATV